MIPVDFTIPIDQAEIAKNIDEIQAQAVELHKRFSTFIDKFNDIGNNIARLNKSLNAAVGSAQRRLLPQGRGFAELAGQNGEIDVADQTDEVMRWCGRFRGIANAFVSYSSSSQAACA